MNKATETLLKTYHNNRQINRDFYELLPEDQFDYRMVDNEKRKSDSPRENLAHILEIQIAYMRGVQNGKLEFKGMDVDHYYEMSKEGLLNEMTTLDHEFSEWLESDEFDSDKEIEAPWGKTTSLGALDGLNSHEVLHTGYNLAIMDHLDMPRYESLRNTWG